jgi:hypothetical protein
MPDTYGNLYVGFILTGLLRELLWALNVPLQIDHLLCDIRQDQNGRLADSGLIYGEEQSSINNVGRNSIDAKYGIVNGTNSLISIPIHDALGYLDITGTNAIGNSASLICMAPINITGTDATSGIWFPIVQNDSMSVDVTWSWRIVTGVAPATADMFVMVDYVTTGGAVVTNFTASANLTLNLSTTNVSNITQSVIGCTLLTGLTGLAGVRNIRLAANCANVGVTGVVEITSVKFTVSPNGVVTAGQNPNFPTSYYQNFPSEDYNSLDALLDVYRPIACSLRYTDTTASQYAAGDVSGCLMTEHSPPGSLGVSSMSGLMSNVKGVTLTNKNGFYGVLPASDVNLRKFRGVEQPLQWDAPYIAMIARIPQSAVNTGVLPAARVQVDVIFEGRSEAQFLEQHISLANTMLLERVNNAFLMSKLVGDNPDHWKRFKRFMAAVGKDLASDFRGFGNALQNFGPVGQIAGRAWNAWGDSA